MLPSAPLPSSSPEGRRLSASFGLPFGAWLVIGAYCAILIGVALSIPFPTRIDEIQHYSVIRAQYEHPALFPDWSRYLTVRTDDLRQWSPIPNYINHPSLYYLLLAPLMAFGGDPLLFRIVNALIATLALLIVVVAVRRRFPADIVSPVWFALFAASFPKGAVVGGLINNDNMAALAAAALFAGLVGVPAAGWWIMVGLALAGWTKLTALLALAAVTGAWLGMRWRRGEIALTDPIVGLTALGLLIGAVPYLATLIQTGQLLWVNQDWWRVPMAERADYDLAGFASFFLRSMLFKWPAAETAFSLPLILASLLASLAVAGIGLRRQVVRPIGLAYAVGIVALIAIHFFFAWRGFQTLGDLTTAQTRYYNVLWPGVALAASAGAGVLARHWRGATLCVAALYQMTTLIGSVALALL